MIIQIINNEARLMDDKGILLEKVACNTIKSQKFFAALNQEFDRDITDAEARGRIQGRAEIKQKLVDRLMAITSGIKSL